MALQRVALREPSGSESISPPPCSQNHSEMRSPFEARENPVRVMKYKVRLLAIGADIGGHQHFFILRTWP